MRLQLFIGYHWDKQTINRDDGLKLMWWEENEERWDVERASEIQENGKKANGDGKEVSLSDGVIYETEKEEEVVTDDRSPFKCVCVCEYVQLSVSACEKVCMCLYVKLCVCWLWKCLQYFLNGVFSSLNTWKWIWAYKDTIQLQCPPSFHESFFLASSPSSLSLCCLHHISHFLFV